MMSKYYPECGNAVDDSAHFCAACGMRFSADSPKTQSSVERRDFVQTVDPSSCPTNNLPENNGTAATAPRKKSKKGLIAVLCSVVAVLVAGAVLFSIFFLPNIIVKNEFKKYMEYFDNGDYRAGYQHDYDIMFGDGRTIDEAIESTENFYKQFPDRKAPGNNEKPRILSVADVPAKNENEIIVQLKEKGYKNTSDIRDIRTITLLQRIYAQNGSDERDFKYVWEITNVTAINVSGKWYFYFDKLYDPFW